MLASKLNICNNVVFIGEVSNSSLPAVLAEQDIDLSASTHDGTSLALLEAMASGLYPVVSNINANRVWIKHGHNGLLHEVSNPQRLAECVRSLVQGPRDVESTLLRNRELVLDRGDRARNMAKLEQIYRFHHLRALRRPSE